MKPINYFGGYVVRIGALAFFLLCALLIFGSRPGAAGPTQQSTTMPPPNEFGSWSAAASMQTPRYWAASVAIGSTRVLVTGGLATSPPDIQVILNSAEIYDSATDAWTATAPMVTNRYGHVAVPCLGGVLVAGGTTDSTLTATANAEIYDPVNDTWVATQTTMNEARFNFTATPLIDGSTVLVAGGSDKASAEIYDCLQTTWGLTGAMTTSRVGHTATLLKNGQVLVAGGRDSLGTTLDTAEIFDPSNGGWTPTGSSMAFARRDHMAALLADGTVLVAGGYDTCGNPIETAEIYDPTSGLWSVAPSMSTARAESAVAIAVPGGCLPPPPGAAEVLIAGGVGRDGYLASSELYLNHCLPPPPGAAGVLIARGVGGDGHLASSELYVNPLVWSAPASMNAARQRPTSAYLSGSGLVLVAGGQDGTGSLASAELFTPPPPPP